MLIETPNISVTCTPGQNWPIALLRGPQNVFPPWSSPRWQPFHANPLLQTAWPSPKAKCALQYPRWAVGANNAIYILYEDFDYHGSQGEAVAVSRRLFKLVPGGGPAVVRGSAPADLPAENR
jgi:hypothetical protein